MTTNEDAPCTAAVESAIDAATNTQAQGWQAALRFDELERHS